ncbi:uncharacterized protein ARMOST_12903 [Armillaria ostoyae]|uniref:Uncharacterized protein n=1 Tax=Armillaria ostoyae TaxID=47428 RepID=A0A284RLF1_ARMOS|nr:uncharacterized protein ARMOST_12903 [Armillaria ostoyae]
MSSGFENNVSEPRSLTPIYYCISKDESHWMLSYPTTLDGTVPESQDTIAQIAKHVTFRPRQGTSFNHDSTVNAPRTSPLNRRASHPCITALVTIVTA